MTHEELVRKYTDKNGKLHETKDFLDQDAVSCTEEEMDEAMEQFEETGCIGFWSCDYCPERKRCL